MGITLFETDIQTGKNRIIGFFDDIDMAASVAYALHERLSPWEHRLTVQDADGESIDIGLY